MFALFFILPYFSTPYKYTIFTTPTPKDLVGDHAGSSPVDRTKS